MKKIAIILIFVIGFSACKKEAGEGGTSVIEGVVYKIHTYESVITELDSLGNIDTTYKVIDTLYYQLDAGKDVFIIYSNKEEGVYDDKFEADYNGRYRFEFLRNGDYTLYTYADSTVEISSTISIKYEYPIFKHIKISAKNSENFVDDFIIEKNQ
tara:strand:+ start:85 stop:549 length:465 start_codon:yes stop_codon:yes gene_type:complete